MLDIWLSRMGMIMTSVDRNSKVLQLARQSDDTKNVNFLFSDFRNLDLISGSLDGVLFLETVGLVSREEDQALFIKVNRWLKQGSKFIIDCPEKVEIANSWTKKLPSGEVSGISSYDQERQIQQIDFTFTDTSGAKFGLLDPTDPIRNSGSGIARYIYSKNQLTHMLTLAGFEIKEVAHYYEKNYYALLCTKM